MKEKTDELWALPGGHADSRLSASRNIKKEISEEAQIEVAVTSLYAIKHQANTTTIAM